MLLPELREQVLETCLQMLRDGLSRVSEGNVSARHPGSGWALRGLGRARAAQGREGEARTTRAQLAAIWARAEAGVQGS